MKIATWNVNSVKARLETVVQWLKEAEPDVVCFQDIKSTDETFPADAFQALGYNCAVHGQKTYNGVAILSKRPMEDVTPRLPGGDANPYLIVAATLGMGLAGIEQGLAPAGESAGVALPRTLPEACDALEASALMRELFGDPLVDLFAALKRHESAERNAAADPRHHWDLVHLVELA